MNFMNILMPGMQNLLGMFQDQHAKVREAIAWVMSKLCEHHAEIFTNGGPQVLAGVMSIFMHAV